MSRHDDNVPLRHMLDYARTACRLTAHRERGDLERDEMFRLALTRAVEVIGEAARRVSESRRTMHQQIPWRQIAGTRDRLIHGYDNVNLDILWNIVSKELPTLVTELEKILRDSGVGDE